MLVLEGEVAFWNGAPRYRQIGSPRSLSWQERTLSVRSQCFWRNPAPRHCDVAGRGVDPSAGQYFWTATVMVAGMVVAEPMAYTM